METRTITFAALVLANLLLITSNLSWKKNIFQIIAEANTSLVVISGFAFVALLLVIYVPFLKNLFHFSSLDFPDLILAFIVACLGMFWFEAIKILRMKKLEA